MLWFALILVSLKHWKQLLNSGCNYILVVICSHFSIFETLETTFAPFILMDTKLWFALILVSLKHWKQPLWRNSKEKCVVICSHFSIFETLETTRDIRTTGNSSLWFALILVSLKHWKQRDQQAVKAVNSCDLLSF